jgi:hypothetical protein
MEMVLVCQCEFGVDKEGANNLERVFLEVREENRIEK